MKYENKKNYYWNNKFNEFKIINHIILIYIIWLIAFIVVKVINYVDYNCICVIVNLYNFILNNKYFHYKINSNTKQMIMKILNF